MDKAKLTEALREHPLTKSLPDRRLERFAKAGDYEVYRDAEAIVTEGMPADAVYLILDGRAAVTRKEAGDRRLAELGGGEILGEMSLVETAARSATVLAVGECRVFRLPNQEIMRLAEEDPRCMNRILVAIIRTLSNRLRKMNNAMAAVAQLTDWLDDGMR